MVINTIYNEDCLEGMKRIPDKSIDMILCDLPYGTSACKWDSIISFELLWNQYNRIIKSNSAIVLTASQPFTSLLIMSNIKNFKYEWIWKKNAGSNFATVKYQPMKEHENILIFGKEKIKYNPQLQERSKSGKNRVKSSVNSNTKNKEDCVYRKCRYINLNILRNELRCPSSVQNFNRERGLHPTQKPIKLFEYLIKTYSNENDTILDNCMGSGTTAIACLNTNRNYIGFEKEEKYFNIANERIINHQGRCNLGERK
jgi:site-specific DNA-methyltransferase (adenine-specific)